MLLLSLILFCVNVARPSRAMIWLTSTYSAAIRMYHQHHWMATQHHRLSMERKLSQIQLHHRLQVQLFSVLHFVLCPTDKCRFLWYSLLSMTHWDGLMFASNHCFAFRFTVKVLWSNVFKIITLECHSCFCCRNKSFYCCDIICNVMKK